MDKGKLKRSKSDAIIAGVCSGIAHYFEVDVTVVRIIFVILAIWGGAGVLLYIIAMIVMPADQNSKEDYETAKTVPNEQKIREEREEATSLRQTASNQVFGVIIVIIGVMFLLRNLFEWIRIERFWPIILIAFGVLLLIPRDNKKG